MICSQRHLKLFFLVVGVLVGLSGLLFLSFDIEDGVYGQFQHLFAMNIKEHLRQDVILDIIGYFNPYLSKDQQWLICEGIMDQALKTGLEPFLVASVIAAESSFRPKAISHCAARGLMQITDTVSMMMGVDNPYDIKQNIAAGTQYLKQLQQRFQNDELVLAAYNAGPTRVARLGRVPRIRETVNYIQKVTRFRVRLQQNLHDRIHRLMVGIAFDNRLAVPQPSIIAGQIAGEVGSRQSGPGGMSDSCEPTRRLFILQA